MVDAWFALLSSLAGVAAGSGATYLGNKVSWTRATRRDLYGRFLGASNAARDSLLLVRYAIKNELPEAEHHARWDEANTRVAEVSALSAQVALIARRPISIAAENVEKHLANMRTALHEADRVGAPIRGDREYREDYIPVLNEFVTAAKAEIGIDRRSRIARR
jgi:hypothetical protein